MDNCITRSLGPGLIMLSLLSACTVEEPPQSESQGIDMIDVPAISESLGPKLAVGPDGAVVLSWLEKDGPDSSLKFSHLIGKHWTSARSIAHGDNWFVNWADFPSVVPISSTFWAAHWLVSRPAGGYAYDVAVALSTDSGQVWSEPITPHRDGIETEHGFVTLYPNNAGVGLIWLDGRNMVNEFTDDVAASGMTLRGASLSPDMVLSNEVLVDGLICDCCQTDVAITSKGPVAVYRDRTSPEIRDIYVTRHIENRWQEGRPVASDNWNIPGCPINGPVIDANENTVVVAWFTAANDVPRVQVGFSTDEAETFSTPIDVVSGETVGRVGLAMLSDGQIAVSWIRKAPTESAEVCIRRVSADGQLGPVTIASGGDNVSTFSFPQMVRTGEDLVLAWTSQVNGSNQVMSARVPIDTL